MRELEGASLQVQNVLLVLPHAVEPLVGGGLERRDQSHVPAGDRSVLSRHEGQRAAGIPLLEEQTTRGVEEGEMAEVPVVSGLQLDAGARGRHHP